MTAETLTAPSFWKGIYHDPVLDDAGVRVDGDLIKVPYRTLDGDVHNWKVFAPSGRSWWEITGLPLIPYGLETLVEYPASGRQLLLITEGESDTLAVRYACAGFERPHPRLDGVTVIGLPGASSWQSSWREFVSHYRFIFLLGDGDAPGRAMNEKIQHEIPWALPVWFADGDDARLVVQRDGPRALDEYLRRAHRDAVLSSAFKRATTLTEFEALVTSAEGVL